MLILLLREQLKMKTAICAFLLVAFSEAKSKKDCQPSATTASGHYAPKKICAGDLIFEDNFDKFNLRVWEHENTLAGGGNWEFQWYTNNRSQSYAKDGILHIRPTFLADDFGNSFLYSGTIDVNGGSPYDSCTNPSFYGCLRTGTSTHVLNPIKSAKIRTLQSFSFKYGKVEVRAKIPSGDWLWPAIWMMPKYNIYSTWPASGEIDIMESRGNKQLRNAQGVNIGTQQVGCTLHWGPHISYNRYDLTHFDKNNDTGFDEDYHKYQLEWTEDYIKFSIDDEEIGTVTPPAGGFWELGNFTGIENPWQYDGTKMAPFDDEFYIIINLAVGGVNGYFYDGGTNDGGDKPWKNDSPHALTDFWKGKNNWEGTWNRQGDDTHLKVDYVKVWAV